MVHKQQCPPATNDCKNCSRVGAGFDAGPPDGQRGVVLQVVSHEGDQVPAEAEDLLLEAGAGGRRRWRLGGRALRGRTLGSCRLGGWLGGRLRGWLASWLLCWRCTRQARQSAASIGCVEQEEHAWPSAGNGRAAAALPAAACHGSGTGGIRARQLLTFAGCPQLVDGVASWADPDAAALSGQAATSTCISCLAESNL